MDSPPRFSDGSPRFTEDLCVYHTTLHQSANIRFDNLYSSSSPPYSQPPHYGVDTHAYSPHGEAPSPMQHRLSNKERPMSPELSSAFPQTVMAAEGDKEVVAYSQPQPLPYQRPVDGSGSGNERRILGMKSKWFYGLLALLIVLAIGLGVGLGVGLGTKDSGYVTFHLTRSTLKLFESVSDTCSSRARVDFELLLTLSSSATPSSSATTSPAATPSPTANADPYAIGGAIDPNYYTTRGAFNGSGIALASQSFASNLQDAPLGSLVMYFQHHSGDIRFQRLTSEGVWVGGSQSEIVASDAKNSTPLSAVAYVQNGTSQWHIFCKYSGL